MEKSVKNIQTSLADIEMSIDDIVGNLRKLRRDSNNIASVPSEELQSHVIDFLRENNISTEYRVDMRLGGIYLRNLLFKFVRHIEKHDS